MVSVSFRILRNISILRTYLRRIGVYIVEENMQETQARRQTMPVAAAPARVSGVLEWRQTRCEQTSQSTQWLSLPAVSSRIIRNSDATLLRSHHVW
ncbi:hypothetical protein BRADI_4g21215v3 [Brachypodium distachyon]|uniref:Uncharacterized protein n=1 Tax=Brachypodium distachyon TaxID=15368 RepID=A0A2K2CP50_BRADI|nr:hypothetical protein BRADI_4g21215v3 [Brachypodium distachyon]